MEDVYSWRCIVLVGKISHSWLLSKKHERLEWYSGAVERFAKMLERDGLSCGRTSVSMIGFALLSRDSIDVSVDITVGSVASQLVSEARRRR